VRPRMPLQVRGTTCNTIFISYKLFWVTGSWGRPYWNYTSIAFSPCTTWRFYARIFGHVSQFHCSIVLYLCIPVSILQHPFVRYNSCILLCIYIYRHFSSAALFCWVSEIRSCFFLFYSEKGGSDAWNHLIQVTPTNRKGIVPNRFMSFLHLHVLWKSSRDWFRGVSKSFLSSVFHCSSWSSL